MLSESQQQQLRDRTMKQLLFNVVVKQMRKQGQPGMQDKVLGLRTPNGCRCSLGWLITEQLYDESYENLCPNAILIDILGMPKLGYQFYDDLQEAHDASARHADWWPAFVREMQKVATKHFLNPSSLQAAI